MEINVLNGAVSRTEFPVSDNETVTLESNATQLISIDFLGLEEEMSNTEIRARNYHSDCVNWMSPFERAELVSELRRILLESAGTEVGDSIENAMPEVEAEARKSLSVDRLLQLLFELWYLLGKLNTERNNSAAKFAEVSVQQAQASGEKGISAANCNFGGALSALVLGAGVAGLGYRQFNKGANGQINNINDNSRGVNRLRAQNVNANNAMGRQPAPASGDTPRERFRALDTENGDLRIQNNQPHLTHEEQSTLHQPMNRMDVRIAGQQTTYDELQYEFGKMQMGGQTILQSSYLVGQVAQQTAGIPAATETAEGKINDSLGQVAVEIQRRDDEAAQHSMDAQQKIASMTTSVAEEANRNVGELSRSIKA